jgi:hypothetical protein
MLYAVNIHEAYNFHYKKKTWTEYKMQNAM